MRAYTYLELEEMRECLINIACDEYNRSLYDKDDDIVKYRENVKPYLNYERIEDKLRTCIMAGVPVQELRDQLNPPQEKAFVKCSYPLCGCREDLMCETRRIYR